MTRRHFKAARDFAILPEARSPRSAHRRSPMSQPAPMLPRHPARLALTAALGAILLGGAARASDCPPQKVLQEHADIGWKDDVGIRRKTLALIDLKGWHEI